jgi:hypothetical protein
MKVKAPSEKNFRRAKVRPGRRKGWRSWISWRHVAGIAAVSLIAYASYRALDLVVSASTLQITKIAVHGNVRLSSGEVEALLDGLRGKSILTVDLEAHRRSLLQSSWVGDVALRRVLPSTIDVLVSERQPMGLCRLGSDLYLVDDTGVVIDQYGPQYAEFDLPIVDGLVRAPGGKTQPAIDEERAALAARVMAALAARRGLGAQRAAAPRRRAVCRAHPGVSGARADAARARARHRLRGFAVRGTRVRAACAGIGEARRREGEALARGGQKILARPRRRRSRRRLARRHS